MQKRYKDRLIFAENLCFALFAVVLFTMSLTVAEVYATNAHMLADVEIANGCAPCGASVALAIQK